jgi:hypothetical protein
VHVAYARPVQAEHGAVFCLVPRVDKVMSVLENVKIGRGLISVRICMNYLRPVQGITKWWFVLREC